MEEALRALLLASPGVTGLVGQRVTWGMRARGAALPAIVLHRITGLPDVTHDGLSGLSSNRVQVDCLAPTHFQALQLARAVIAATGGHRMAPFQKIVPVSQRDDQEADAVEEPVFRNSLDLMVWHAAA